MSTVDTRLRLSSQTLDWLAKHPHARRFVRSVWDKLADLERAGQHPEAVAALRRVLTHHQPTSAGRCRTCARVTCRRRPFPCIVWHQIRGELCGQFTTAVASRLPSPPDHRNPPPMLNREQPAPFLIIGDSPGGALAVPTASARAAAQAARHLTEYCPHTRATWQVNPHATLGPVVVFGCARPPTGQHLLDQDTHAFLLAPGQALPPMWRALCGYQIGHTEFEALDQGMGRPCQDCYQRRTAPRRQHTGLPVRSPGEHLHPQLRRPPVAGRSPGGGSST